MNKDLQNKFFRLKQYQFIGGIISVLTGALLVIFDVNDAARFNLGASGIKLGVSAVSGVAVIIAGIFLFFRSGGGIKAKAEAQRKNGLKKDKFEMTVDAYIDYSDSSGTSSIVCPECSHGIEKGNISLSCVCEKCKNRWIQRIPS